MSFVAVAIGAGALLAGTVYSADQARSASHTQADAANNASQLQYQMWLKQQANLAPWMKAGQGALGQEMNMLGLGKSQLTPQQIMAMDPGYQFRLNQGTGAIMNNMSALGGVNSGNTMRALMGYGQDYASSEFGNIFSRLNTLSGTGVNAAGSIAGLGMNTATNIGNNMMSGANALAAGQIGSANALAGGVGQGVNSYLLYQAMLQNQGGGGGGGGNFNPSFDYTSPQNLSAMSGYYGYGG